MGKKGGGREKKPFILKVTIGHHYQQTLTEILFEKINTEIKRTFRDTQASSGY